MSSRESEPRIGYADMVAFACEIAMFVLLIAAINYLVDGGRSWLIGAALAIVVAVVWARWIAPSAERRLDDPARYTAQAALFVMVGALAAFGGLLWWGVVFTATSLVAFAFSRSEDRST